MNAPQQDSALDDRLQKLTERVGAEIAGLHRKNRGLRRLVGGLTVAVLVMCGLLAAVWMDPALVLEGRATDGPVVRAGSFVLVDSEGRDRGRWAVGTDGRARFDLNDPAGQSRLTLTVLSSGFPGIALSNDDGQRRVVLGVLPDETGTLVFADEGGAPRAVMGVSPTGSANLVFGDGRGEGRVGMGMDASGTATLLLPDSAEEPAESSIGSLDPESP